MTIKAATPYLILGGRAAEAIDFYKHALGAQLQSVQRFGEVIQNCPEAMKEAVMHAELRVGEAMLMMSDGGGPGEPIPPRGPVSVALNIEGAQSARSAFEALSAEGKVVEPLDVKPWGALFGVVVDRFGINWMFNSTTD